MLDIIKYIQILYGLFPFLFSIVVLALVLKKGWKFLQRYTWFWLIGMIITGAICIQVFFSSSVKGSTAMMALIAFGNCYSAYRLLKKKKSKK